jgi:hypothetical protein
LLAFSCFGYLAGLLSFILWGDRRKPASVTARIIASVALGGAIAFLVYGLREFSSWGPGSTYPEKPITLSTQESAILSANREPDSSGRVAAPVSEAPWEALNPVNAVAAVLAVVLAVLTLIAQRIAKEAQVAAGQARLDMMRVSRASLLSEWAHAARIGVDEFTNLAGDEGVDERLAGFYTAASLCLSRLGKFLIAAHRWTLEPHMVPVDEVVGKAHMCLLAFEAFSNFNMAQPERRDVERDLRVSFWQPTARLIETQLDALQDSAEVSATTDGTRVITKLQALHSELIAL